MMPVDGMPDRLWTVHDVAAFLGKPVSWVYENYRAEFDGCYCHFGQAIRFDSGRVKAVVNGRIRPPKN